MSHFEERARRVVARHAWPDNECSAKLGRAAVTLARRLDQERSPGRRRLLESALRSLSEFDAGPPDVVTLLTLRSRCKQLGLDPRAELPELYDQ